MALISIILSVFGIILAMISISIAVKGDKQAKKAIEKAENIEKQTAPGGHFV